MRNIEILLREAEIYQHLKRWDEAVRTLNRASPSRPAPSAEGLQADLPGGPQLKEAFGFRNQS
jgi:hypothetical protein